MAFSHNSIRRLYKCPRLFIISPRRINCPRVWAWKKKPFQFFFRNSLTVPKKGWLPIFIHWNELYPILIQWAELHPILLQWAELYPILIHWAELNPILLHWAKYTRISSRQPIKFNYYVTPVVNQSRSSNTSPESSQLGMKTLLVSRLRAAPYNLS